MTDITTDFFDDDEDCGYNYGTEYVNTFQYQSIEFLGCMPITPSECEELVGIGRILFFLNKLAMEKVAMHKLELDALAAKRFANP